MAVFVLSPDETLRAAMSIIEKAEAKICVVQGLDGKILRTVTDGDVRRFLLSGGSMDDALSNLPEKRPITAPEGSSFPELLQKIEEHAIPAILIVDKAGHLVQICSRASLENKILLSPPHIGGTEMSFVKQAFDDNWVAPAGPHLELFEQKFGARIGRGHALALSSGTAALHLALRVLDIGAGDRVYVSDLTFAASLQPILYQNATPVLIDAEPTSWNMSPVALERKLKKDKADGKLPSAIIVAHLYGQSADVITIMALADAYGVPVVEDAAESLGATIRNSPSGSHGLLSAFSFNGNKMITTSGGGALVSSRSDLIDRARRLSTQGRDPFDHYQHSEIAYNYRMSNILAAIGLGQLEVLEERVARRREIFNIYRKGLSDIAGISFQTDPPSSQGSRWLTVIELNPDHIPFHPYQIMRRLREVGIETRPAWKPMHMQPLCRGLEIVPHSEDEIVSSMLFLRSLCLPSGSSMSNGDVDRVVSAIASIIKEG